MALKILIIDDEPDVVKYLTTVLEIHDYEAYTAGNVAEGLESLHQITPDLICLDIMMPRELGFSLYTQIKSDKRYRRIPVLIISGVVQEADFDFRQFVPDEKIPPPDAYLEKPIKVEEFIDVVTNLTANSTAKTRQRAGNNG